MSGRWVFLVAAVGLCALALLARLSPEPAHRRLTSPSESTALATGAVPQARPDAATDAPPLRPASSPPAVATRSAGQRRLACDAAPTSLFDKSLQTRSNAEYSLAGDATATRDDRAATAADDCRLRVFRQRCRVATHASARNGSGSGVCAVDASAPLVKVQRKSGKRRAMRFEQQCGAMPPLLDAIDSGDVTRTRVWLRGPQGGGSDEEKQTASGDVHHVDRGRQVAGGAALEPRGVAVLLSGEMRRVGVAAAEQRRMWVDANGAGADVFTATWPTPSDERVAASHLGYARDQLARHFGAALAGVRVDTFTPRMFVRGAFYGGRGNTAAMLFLAEAAARLAATFEDARRGGRRYTFFIRSRFDLVPLAPLRLSWANPRSSREQELDKSAAAAMWRIDAAGDGEPPVITATLPAATAFAVHHSTLCCINDWLAAGPAPPGGGLRASALLFSFVSRLAAQPAAVSVPPGALSQPARSSAVVRGAAPASVVPSAAACSALAANLSSDAGDAGGVGAPRARARALAAVGECYAEPCMARLFRDSGIRWAVRDLRVQLGSEQSMPRNVQCREAPELTKCT